MKKTVLIGVTLTIAALALTACGESQPKTEPATTTAAAETTTIAETTKAVAPIVGSWKYVKMVVTDGKEEVEQDATTETYCKFEEDGTVIMTDNGKATSGTWKEAAPATYLAILPDNEMTFTLDGDKLVYQFESAMSKGTFSQFVFERE